MATKITKEVRLEVLNQTKQFLLHERKIEFLPYICIYVGRGLCSVGISEIYKKEIFNFDMAKRICRKLHLKNPTGGKLGWWKDYDYKTRLSVINQLIKEAEEL
jgi:hypothetical protein